MKKKDDDSTTSASSSLEESEMTERISSPSPSLMRRSRSNSPGKTVTFCEESLETARVNEIEKNRSLNELDASPRRMIDLKRIEFVASNLIGSHLKRKRKAPSPPDNATEDVIQVDDSNSDTVAENEPQNSNGHEALGIKLSATLRNTFGLNKDF